MGTPGSQECQSNKNKIVASCQQLRVPLVLEKCTDPGSVMVFLGFKLDTTHMLVRLLEKKMQQILSSVQE